jgi:hypothetical protein
MHRRSRTGLWDFLSILVTLLVVVYYSAAPRLTQTSQVATLADCDEKSAMRAPQPALHASTLGFDANTSGPCGGATMINAGFKKTISR